MSALIGRDALLGPLREALQGAPADEVELWAHRRRAAITRYSRSSIHQNAVSDEIHVEARAVVGRALGTVTTNSLEVDDLRGRPEEPAAGLSDLPLGADRPSDGHRSPEVDRHPGRHAPRAAADDRPGHHLVKDRAQDAAVGDALPALEPGIQGQLGPAPVGAAVELEVEAVLVQLAAGEAAMRLEAEGLPGDLGGRPRVRCQDCGPSEPRS